MSSVLLKRQSVVTDDRRHQRVPVVANGRYMLSDFGEYACQTIDMSPGSASLSAPVAGHVGERVVCYLDHFGRFDGYVTRVFDGGFAMEFTAPLSKRERLADQLTWHANKAALNVPEDRHHQRIVPRQAFTTLQLADGRRIAAEILDLSVGGVALACPAMLPVGSPVTVGRRAGRVLRTSKTSMAVEFLRPIPREEFDDSITL